jgi:hypothetical protein
MSIVATCPYCRAGGVRAPDSAAGAIAKCPKCKSNYTVVPDTGLPGWSKPEAPAPLDDTRPQVAMADVTEPSPVLPKEASRPTPAAPRVPSTPSDPPPVGLGIALAAYIPIGLAVAATLLPYGRGIGIGLAALGLLIGLFAIGSSSRWIAAVAMLVNAIVVAVLLLAPSWFGLEAWKKPVPPGGVNGPQTLAHGTGNAAPADWVNAAGASWTYGDLRVSVVSANVTAVELVNTSGAKRMSKDQCLVVLLRVANDGVERRIDLRGWAAGEGGAELTDAAANLLKAKSFEPGWEPVGRAKPGTGLFPGKTVDVPLYFQWPATKPDDLRLKLPGDALGIEEPIRFKLPVTFVHVPNAKSR